MLTWRFYPTLQSVLITGNFLFPLPALSATEVETQMPPAELQRFADSIYLVKNNYVTAVNNYDLFDHAIQGMLTGLDPNSTVLDKNYFTEQVNFDNNNPADIGLELTMDNGVLKVITPLIDTPAFKAGIQSGDYIIKLASKSTQGLSLEEAVRLLRGKEGSSVQLVILRKGATKPLFFSVARDKLEIQSVTSKLLDNQYGYIRIAQFQDKTGSQMSAALNQLQKQAGGKLKGLVLDLRYNPGGALESAIEVADAFIDNSALNNNMLIVRSEGRIPNLKYTAIATPGDVFNKRPIVVLINNGSASTAEVVAAALKDNKRAITVGTKSFGKGSVQTVLPLDDKRAMKLTTAIYYTPAGQSIQDKGVTPDIAVEALSITKNTQDGNAINFNEADLKDHLLNAKQENKPVDNKANLEIQDLLHQDYQLYTALTILKGTTLNR